MVKPVIWSNMAEHQLMQCYKYILKYSYQNAEMVKKDVISSAEKLGIYPENIRWINIERVMMAVFELMNYIDTGLRTELREITL